jgi:hypothetical protein
VQFREKEAGRKITGDWVILILSSQKLRKIKMPQNHEKTKTSQNNEYQPCLFSDILCF